jgi:phosphoribosylformimino-5-aminoimidazole carboxamide ribotide isomerase
MILFPSIHLKDGAVARLTHDGDLEQADILHHDPAARAAEFETQGFPWLHVVDLNGAFEGNSTVNEATIESIIKSVKIPVQLSGGIRSLATVENWIKKGVQRVVLTSIAIKNPDLTREICRLFPGRIAIKVDSRGGRVASTGWAKTSSVKALDLALRVEEAGAAALIYADINSGGALGEVNVEAVIDLAFSLTLPVIASGGVHSLQDLAELKGSARTGVAGLILGRALYNGSISASEALSLAAA